MKKINVCSHQLIEVFVGVTDKFEFQRDITLQNEVKYIMLPYPFRIEHNGTQNVYEITPTKSLTDLILKTQEVMKREYELGKCEAPHSLGDFMIESVVVHENNSATIEVGS